MIPCTIKTADLSLVLPSNMAAVWRIGESYGKLQALSVAGHERQIQAVHAGLQDASLSLAWNAKGAWDDYHTIKRWESTVTPDHAGFEIRKAKLAYDTWQLVAVSRDWRFMLHATDAALWRILRGPEFTTPLLRSWMPTVRKRLSHMGLLKTCDCFGAPFDQHGTPSYILAQDDALDRLVSALVRGGQIKLAA